jgi:hypothetical protein
VSAAGGAGKDGQDLAAQRFAGGVQVEQERGVVTGRGAQRRVRQPGHVVQDLAGMRGQVVAGGRHHDLGRCGQGVQPPPEPAQQRGLLATGAQADAGGAARDQGPGGAVHCQGAVRGDPGHLAAQRGRGDRPPGGGQRIPINQARSPSITSGSVFTANTAAAGGAEARSVSRAASTCR